MIDDTTRRRLLAVALAQRGLSIALGILLAVIVAGSVAFAFAGRDLEFVIQMSIVIVALYMAAATVQLSRALGDMRGLRITLACLVVFLPLGSVIVPLVMLWRARRRVRAEDGGLEAGFFTVSRAEMEWLKKEPGLAMVCVGCGYDLAGIGERPLCPECGRARE